MQRCRFNENVRVARPKTKLMDQGQSQHVGAGCPTSAVKTLFQHLCHLLGPMHCITVAAIGHCIAMRGDSTNFSTTQQGTNTHLLIAAKDRLLVLRTAWLTGNTLEADVLLLLLG